MQNFIRVKGTVTYTQMGGKPNVQQSSFFLNVDLISAIKVDTIYLKSGEATINLNGVIYTSLQLDQKID